MARIGHVRISADQGSGRVTVDVAGKSAELTARHGAEVAARMREAVKRANAC